MNYKKTKKKMYGFTLIELVIVLIIIWLLTVFSLWISNDQIQKVKNKTVKESILSEWQSRYSRNLWSSSIKWTIYKHMDITLTNWSNMFDIKYFTWNNEDSLFLNDFYTNKFTIKNIFSWEYDKALVSQNTLANPTLVYNPYRIACKIKDWDNELDKITLTLNINNKENADYCFELNSENCRLVEVHNSKCWIDRDQL